MPSKVGVCRDCRERALEEALGGRGGEIFVNSAPPNSPDSDERFEIAIFGFHLLGTQTVSSCLGTPQQFQHHHIL